MPSDSRFSLLQGDCFDHFYDIADGTVDLVLTDIPYGEVNRDSGGLRNLQKGAADLFDNALLENVAAQCARVTKGAAYVFCGTKQISSLVEQFAALGMTTRVGVWSKTNPSPMNGSRLWVSGLEFCVYARKPKAVHHEHCKKALWESPSGRSKVHPTEKPVPLFQRLVEASSDVGAVVLDCFMGSGTTGVACANTGCRFIGIERDETYFQIARDRITAAYEGAQVPAPLGVVHHNGNQFDAAFWIWLTAA